MTSPHRRKIVLSLASAPLALHGRLALSASYPTGPVQMVVPFAPGGATDILARALTPGLTKAFGQPFTVANRPGDGGNLGAAEVARAAPDGLKLFVCNVGTHAVNQSLYANLPFDPVKDFAPITLIANVPNVLVVNPAKARQMGWTTLADLVRQGPTLKEPLKMASGGTGTSAHMAGELFKIMTGTPMSHHPYNGMAPALVDVLSGKMDLMFDNLPSSMPHIKAGRLLALGVTATTRSMSLLDVPTIEEAGGPQLAGYDATAWFGLLAPAGTPLQTVARLQMETARVLTDADVRKRMYELGAIPSGMSSAAFSRMLASETRKWATVVKTAGARAA